jgi:hypothetical protein
MELSELNMRRDALVRKIADGVQRLENGDRSITYQTVEDNRKALQLLDVEIAKASQSALRRRTRLVGRSGL